MAHIFKFLCLFLIFNFNFYVSVCLSRDKDGAGPYDLGEFDQALFLYLDGQNPNSSVSLQEQNSEFGVFFS